MVLTARYVPESRAAVKRRLDPFGQVLVIAALGALTFGIIEGPDLGWGSAAIIGCFALAAAATAVLIAWSSRAAQPLIDLRFFRSLPFSGAALTAVTGMCGFSGFLFLITLYLQEVRGYSALTAGLFLVPMAAVMACSAPLCGRVIAAHGTRIPLLIAGTGITAGGVLLTFLTAASPAWYVLLSCVVLGAGVGWVNAPVTNNAVAGMPRARAGTASGIASTSRQVGSIARRRRRRVRARRGAARFPGRGLRGRYAAGLVDRGGDGGVRLRACRGHQRPRRAGQRARAAVLVEHADRAAPGHAVRAA